MTTDHDNTWIPSGSLRCTLLFCLGYLICCIAAQQLASPGQPPFVSFWPAAGLYLAVLTLAERRDWPRLIGAATAANLAFDILLQGTPVGLGLLYCVATTTEAVLGSWLLCTWRNRTHDESRFRNLLALTGAGIACAICGATLGLLATALAGNGRWQASWWIIWWSSDVIGILLFGPVVLNWRLHSQITASIVRSPWRLLELSVLLSLLLLRTWMIGQHTEYSIRALPLGVLPLLLWAAVRFGVRGVSLALVLFFGVLVQATIHGRGIFGLGNDSMEVRIMFLQFAAGTLGLSFLSLASLIEDRNRALEDARRSRAAAEQANTAKSRFLANMSHELRTPLNGILGMTELVLDSNLAPQQRERLTLVRGSSESLLALLNDILDLSKVEAGRIELRPTEFSLRSCLQDIISFMGPQAEHKGLELTCRLDPAVPDQLLADRGRLRQVLMNLLGNAVKFTHEGCIRLEVDAKPQHDDRVLLKFCVGDTGIGIAPDVQQRLFAPFEQGIDNNRYGGTGLGLSIVRQLVSLMGGTVWLESEPGRGSRFHFTIAATVVDPQPPPGRATAITPQSAVLSIGARRDEPRLGARRDVLLVEDDHVSALLARAVLENAGFTVSLAEDGGTAVHLWQSGEYAFILSDLRMPVKNGLELAREIREHEEQSGNHTPIILLSASAQPAEHAQCMEAGIDACLSKPLRADELLAVIRELKVES